ncbi:MAG: glycosyltransferase family 4 protein [Actinobacteria bacterium]|nr:glycosyltransferase family 4 protein [Actinomycetota bacterium]
MRVLFVTNMWPDDQHAHYGSFVFSQARSLRELGLELDVLHVRGYMTHWEYARGMGQMLKRNFESDHDIVHAHYGHSAVVARVGWRRPLVVSYCGDDLLGTPLADDPSRMSRGSRVLAGAFAQWGRLADATITKSEEMAAKLPATVRCRNHVIPNGVDLDMFKPIDRQHARRRLGWDADEKVALFVGDPSNARKNHPLAVAACRVAAARCPSLKLMSATAVAPELVPVWMSAADVLVHPSWSEGSPNTVKEAMACELPIVATPVGDVKERLRGIPGCHVVGLDPKEFADALLDAIEHKPCPAARTAVADLSLQHAAERIVAVYDSVLARRRRGPADARVRSLSRRAGRSA